MASIVLLCGCTFMGYTIELPSERRARLAREEAERAAIEKRKAAEAARKREEAAEKERRLAKHRELRKDLFERFVESGAIAIPDEVLDSRVLGRPGIYDSDILRKVTVRTVLGNLLCFAEEHSERARLENWRKHRDFNRWSVDLRTPDGVVTILLDFMRDSGMTLMLAESDGVREPGLGVIVMLGLNVE
jgi:hypothetical protein